MTAATLYVLTAEVVLVAAAMAIYVGGAFVESTLLWRRLALGAVLTAAVALAVTGGTTTIAGGTTTGHWQPVAFDGLSYYVRWLALGTGLMLVLMSPRPTQARGAPEYTGSLLLTVAGLMLVASANELVLLFVGLELISIPTYILLYLGRSDSRSREATAKYFYLSILSSAVLLYGFSFLYGTAGTTALGTMSTRLAEPGLMTGSAAGLIKVALVLVFAGLGFRIAAVPFHFYAPDVYQGTTHTNAALLSVLAKAAGLVALVRLLVVAMPGLGPYGWRVALALSLLTMTFGNVLALWQDNLRRLLAYSSIAHAGYLLIGLAVGLAQRGAAGRGDGVAAIWFYLALYALATLGTFAALIYLGRGERPIENVDELAGLARTRPWAASAIALFMFSLTGLPPLAGFWGKLAVFGSALSVDAGPGGPESLRHWFIVLAVAGVLNAAVSAAYYLRVVAVMYFRAPLATPRAEGGRGSWLVTLVCALLVVGVGLYSGPLWRQALQASPTSGTPQAAPTGLGYKHGPASNQHHRIGPTVALGTPADLRPR